MTPREACQYPRHGQRIAPVALGELLGVPIPESFGDEVRRAYSSLAALDETVWERLDVETCRRLAEEVLRVIGRALRMSTSVVDRLLPALPPGRKLADLELESRTMNALMAVGMHHRAQDLALWTVGRILGLRGFGVKGLLDLLTALEHVIDHPESRRNTASASRLRLHNANPAGRYPHPYCRLAPRTLREILMEPIPQQWVAGTSWENALLADLDETVWDHLPAETIARLAALVIRRVTISGHNQQVRQQPLPALPQGMTLDDLHLENRTRHCLVREGLYAQPEKLAAMRIGDLLSLRALGAKSLLDLLTRLEAVAARDAQRDHQLSASARALANLPEATAIHFSDPRFGPLLRAMDSEANSVAELLPRVLQRQLDPPDPPHLCRQMGVLRGRVAQSLQLTVEQELVEIFTPADNPRNRWIIAAHYGWEGGAPSTLAELGRKYGLSRERVRQVCIRAIRQHRGARIFTPALDHALAFIAKRLPRRLESLQADLDASGLTSCGLPLAAISRAAGFLGRDPQFTVVRVDRCQLVVRLQWAGLARTIVQAARQRLQSRGIATLNDMVAELSRRRSTLKADADLIAATLQAVADFRWLDAKHTWFRLDSLPQYGLCNLILKALSVANPIEISKLRAAALRSRRFRPRLPPQAVLLEFCRHMPGVGVALKRVTADPPPDWRVVLGSVEQILAEVLREHGPIMDRAALEEECLRRGVNRFSFNATVMSSPIVVPYGGSVYGLLGAKVNRKMLDAAAFCRAKRAVTRVLCACGHTRDGKVYLLYRLSPAAISGGVLTLPASVRSQGQGRFVLLADGGRTVGTMVCKHGCAWGLGPALREQHAVPGDYLVIVLDSATHEARIRIGDRSIVAAVTGEEK